MKKYAWAILGGIVAVCCLVFVINAASNAEDAMRQEQANKARLTAKCPANDVIIYVDDIKPEDRQKGIICPITGQETAIVRDEKNEMGKHFSTYIRCSCPKEKKVAE